MPTRTLEDFAVILTRHPATISRYYTPEHILYDAMEWARRPPEDKLSKRLWHEVHEREKTFEGMVAERLITTGTLQLLKCGSMCGRIMRTS
jgi:hypothetical protein